MHMSQIVHGMPHIKYKTVFDGSDTAADFVDRPSLVINQAGDNTQTAFGPVSPREALSLLHSREPFAWSYRDNNDEILARGRYKNYSEMRSLVQRRIERGEQL